MSEINNIDNLFFCPECGNYLNYKIERFNCLRCQRSWRVVDGILFFSNFSFQKIFDESNPRMLALVDLAKKKGWQSALYDHNKVRVANGKYPLDDQRRGDWRFYLPFQDSDKVLMIGLGFGSVGAALSYQCSQVYAVDDNWAKLFFNNIRKKQQNINNFYLAYVRDFNKLPFTESHFDFISAAKQNFTYGRSVKFSNLAKEVYKLLKEKGHVRFNVPNKFSLQSFLNKKYFLFKKDIYTLKGYKKLLEKIGFKNIKFYAPLPRYNGIPLFYLDLYDKRILQYFFEDIFSLFEMVSPEVKKQFGLEYSIAKFGVKLIKQLHMHSLVKYFVSGYEIIASK